MISFQKFTESAANTDSIKILTKPDYYHNYNPIKKLPLSTPVEVVENHIFDQVDENMPEVGIDFIVEINGACFLSGCAKSRLKYIRGSCDRCYVWGITIRDPQQVSKYIKISDNNTDLGLAFKVSHLVSPGFAAFMVGNLEEATYSTDQLFEKIVEYKKLKLGGISDSDINTINSI